MKLWNYNNNFIVDIWVFFRFNFFKKSEELQIIQLEIMVEVSLVKKT